MSHGLLCYLNILEGGGWELDTKVMTTRLSFYKKREGVRS